MVGADPEPGSRRTEPEEHSRIRGLYEATYREERYRRLWSGPGPHLIHRWKWEALRPLLASLGLPRQDALVLDLGAGAGIDCVEMDRIGWPRSGIVALDLVAPDLRAARRQLPGLPAALADAAQLPIGDARVDLVFQSTMISSVLDAGLRSAIYTEAGRVLKPGGAFVSYDTRYPNPWNRNTRPVSAAELRGAFPGWPLRLRSVTLLPPLVRRLAPISEGLCGVFERLPFLRSHFIACAVKP
jgi:SAM-dependent methyltransferase